MNFVIQSKGPEICIFKTSQVFLNAIYYWKTIAYLTVRQVMQQLYQSESESCSVGSDCLRPHGLYSAWDSPGQNTGVGSCSLLQGIFPTQG